jgi:lipopolysaccharide/colanic/teichoic acid biosynthesis glycosyltransferase
MVMPGKGFRALFESQTGAITYPDIEFRVATRSRPRLSTREYALKRAMDFTLASVGMLVAAPIWLTIAAANKLEDGGPVFFVQNRWGRHKRPFKVYKFRYDRFYIERQSLWLDVKLILLSCWISLKFKWEQRGRKVHGRRRSQ